MEKIKNFIKFIIKIYRFFKIDLILSLFLFHFSLLLNLRKIFSKKLNLRKIVLISEGGFGHTLHDVEMIKLTLKEGFIVVILSEHKRHNWELVKIWKDIKVIHIFKAAPFFSRRTQLLMQKYCSYILYKLTKIYKRKIIEFENNYNKEYLNPENGIVNKLIDKASAFPDYEYINDIKFNWLSYRNQYEGYYAYIFLKNKLKINLVQLEKRIKNNFESNLRKINIKNKQIINIYLRQKGKDNRCGSSIEEWSRVINYLYKKNYFICITGDINIKKFPKSVINKINSYRQFGVSKNIFNICAPYFCNFYISEQGGGSWFGVVMNKPTLMVNCCNFANSAYGINYYLLYQNLKDINTNNYIPLEKSMKEYFWDIDLPKDKLLEKNNSEQIIQGFEDLQSKKKCTLFKEINTDFKYSFGTVSNAQLVSSNVMN